MRLGAPPSALSELAADVRTEPAPGIACRLGALPRRYLWPYFQPASASPQHVLSIVLMVNEKCRQRVPAWEFVGDASDKFSALFARVLNAALYEGCSVRPWAMERGR